MELKRKFAVAATTGALLFNAIAPAAYAGTTIQLSGNGSNSNNTANVSQNSSQTVVQNNTANVTNNIDVDAKTGGNDANDNTGGEVSIDTGNANVSVNATTNLNSNSAELNCCPNGNTDVLIKGNGTNSDNNVTLNSTNNTNVFQDNNARVRNNVDVDAETGDNDAKDNTGGDVSIDTGNADVDVTLSTAANANSARVGGNGDNGGSLSLRILDNGSNSDNDIDLDLDNSTNVVQDNYANVTNNVDADAKTGGNDANDNTGGEVAIDTGDAGINVEADTMVNFNAADVNCGCLFDDLLAKIDGNGTYSDNNIDASLAFNDGDKEGTFQDNKADVTNKLDELNAKTGYNNAEDNTGASDEESDPSIDTGNAWADVAANTAGNVNVVGPDSSWDLPEVDFNLDLGDLLDLLGLLGLD